MATTANISLNRYCARLWNILGHGYVARGRQFGLFQAFLVILFTSNVFSASASFEHYEGSSTWAFPSFSPTTITPGTWYLLTFANPGFNFDARTQQDSKNYTVSHMVVSMHNEFDPATNSSKTVYGLVNQSMTAVVDGFTAGSREDGIDPAHEAWINALINDYNGYLNVLRLRGYNVGSGSGTFDAFIRGVDFDPSHVPGQIPNSDGVTPAPPGAGTQGPQGPVGPAGKDGKDGKDGVAGPAGKDGINGTNGIDGKDGKDGIAGVAGPTGPAGAVGPQGPIGIGIDGVNGKDGANGHNGRDGVDGINGTNGSNGTNGTNGRDGVAGSIGPRGLQGIQGIQGLQGERGADAPGVDITPIVNAIEASGDKVILAVNDKGEAIVTSVNQLKAAADNGYNTAHADAAAQVSAINSFDADLKNGLQRIENKADLIHADIPKAATDIVDAVNRNASDVIDVKTAVVNASLTTHNDLEDIKNNQKTQISDHKDQTAQLISAVKQYGADPVQADRNTAQVVAAVRAYGVDSAGDDRRTAQIVAAIKAYRSTDSDGIGTTTPYTGDGGIGSVGDALAGASAKGQSAIPVYNINLRPDAFASITIPMPWFGGVKNFTLSSHPETGSALDIFRLTVRLCLLLMLAIAFVFLLSKVIREY